MKKKSNQSGEYDRNEIKRSLIFGVNSYNTICETLRLICDEMYERPDNERIIELLVDAMIMAKKMDKRLRYFRFKYEDNSGNNASNLGRLYGTSARRKLRRERVL